MLDVDDLDYEPENEDGLMEKMNRINQTEDSLKIRQKNILRDFKSGSLSYVSLSHMGKTFRDKIKSFNVHVGVEGSFRNKYVPYSKSEEKQFLDSSSEDENSSQSHVEKSKSCGESDLSESLKSDSYQFSNESLPFNEPQNVNNLNTECDDYSDCTSKQSANQSTAQSNKNMAVKKETAVVEKKKCSKNFTITLTGSSRLLNHKKRFKKWDVQVEDVLKDDVMKLTYLESVFQFTAEAENDSHSTLGSQRSQTTEKSTFKLPLRRPPTRQKTTAKNLSVSVDLNLNKTKVTSVGNLRELPTISDDVLSLIASTTIEEEKEQENALHTGDSYNIPNNTVKRSENVEMDKVKHWLNSQHNDRTTTFIDYSNVPDIYKGLCYQYFFNASCTRWDRCRNSHNLNGSLSKLNKIGELNDDDLREAHNFAISRPSFYGKIYKYFTKVFAKKDMKSELINIVHTIFDKQLFSIDSVEGLTDILDCLEQTDLGTFEDSVEYLLLEVNIKQFPILGSIIFEVICNKQNICHYWPIIRRLVLIGEKMSVKLGTKFLVKLMKMPVDINFCKNVDQLIQKYEFVNLNEIASDIVKAFRQVCTQEETTSTVSKNNQVEFQHTLLNREQQTQNKPKSAPVIFSPPNLTSQNETFGNNCDFSIDSSKDCDLRTFGENVSECQDFASLCFKLPSSNYRNNNLYVPKQQTSTLNPSQAFLHAKRSLDQSSNESIFRRSFDSDGGDSRICPLLSDSSSFENSSGCSSLQNFGIGRAYNKDGLFYDPTNDYVPSAKKPKLVLSLDQYHQRNANQDRYKPKSQSSTSESESGMAQEYFDQDIRNVLVNLRVNEEELFQNNSNNRMDKVREYNGPQQRNLPSFRFPKNRSNISLTANSINNYRLSEKPPEQPLFGKLPFNPDYELNISLHHLYLEQIDNIDLDEADIFALNNCIIKADGKTFLNFVEKYKGPMTIQNFISMTLAHLIGRNQMMAEVFVALLTSIENYNPHYYANVSIKVVLEVIIMNFLFELEKRNLFNATRKLLLKFSDWDSLVSSRLFINKNISLIGRYLFIAKLFVHTEPELTYEIMICPKFHLLEDCSKWPYDLTPSIPGAYQTDLELRNMILHIFFTESFLLNPIVVIQLYKTALKTGISHFDVKPFIEMMVITLVNRNNRVSLKQVLNELDLFSRYLKKSTMRAFLVIMAKHTNILDVYRLFDKCVERGIYQRLFRAEAVVHTVYIKTDMPDDEIELIIRYYFSKLVQLRNLPPGSETLKFDIGLPGQIENLPILQCCRSIVTVNAIVRHYIMAICSLEAKSSTFSLVEIKKDDLIKYLEKNRSKI